MAVIESKPPGMPESGLTTQLPVVVGRTRSGSPERSPIVDRTNNDFLTTTTNILHWSDVVLPIFAASANRRFNSSSDRLGHIAGLVDAYHIVEAHPDNVLDQERALLEKGVVNKRVVDRDGRVHVGYLEEVKEMKGMMDPVQNVLLKKLEDFSYPQRMHAIELAKKNLGKNLGKDLLQFLPKEPEQPEITLEKQMEILMENRPEITLEMVTELVTAKSMLDIFRQDSYEQTAELRKRKIGGKKLTKKEKKQIVAVHITGLLQAQADLQHDSPAEEYFVGRLEALQEKLMDRKQDIVADAPHWTDVQWLRHIREAVKGFTDFRDVFNVKEQSGVTNEMIYDAKKAKNKGMGMSTVWGAGVEVAGVATGWGVGLAQENIPDFKHLTTLLVAAGLSRAMVYGLLTAKGIYTEKLVDKYGFAPDPLSKWAKEKYGKAWKGFVPYHASWEAMYTSSTALGVATIDWTAAAMIELMQNGVAISRMSAEVLGMRKAVKEQKAKQEVTVVPPTEVFVASQHAEA